MVPKAPSPSHELHHKCPEVLEGLLYLLRERWKTVYVYRRISVMRDTSGNKHIQIRRVITDIETPAAARNRLYIHESLLMAASIGQ